MKPFRKESLQPREQRLRLLNERYPPYWDDGRIDPENKRKKRSWKLYRKTEYK